TLALLLLAAGGRNDTVGYDGPFDPGRVAGHIPEPMLGAYLDAAEAWDIDWALLAAVGKLECDHFRSRLPGCWPPGSVNHAGARGPMQFLGSTWRASAATHQPDVAGPPPPPGGGYGVDGDGDGAGRDHVGGVGVLDEVGDVRRRRRGDDALRRADLDDVAVLHDRDAIAEPERLVEVVRDEHDRAPELPLEP
ncbi:MAG: hypothetical protein ACNA8R_15700, partial [Nitriliruptoraceae bacterium]